jgi:uncharacterized coiled-coil protein SlyX
METKTKTILQIIAGIVFLAVVVIGLTIIHDKKTQVELLNSRNAGLNTTIRDRDSLVNEMTTTFDEIEKNLTFVREKRGQLTLATTEGNKTYKELLVEDIRLMNEMLVQSSKKIDELDKKLKASGFEIKSFKNKIAELNNNIIEQDNNIKQLTAELEKRDYKIAEMDNQITVMQTNISSKSDTISIKSQIIEEKDNELNKAYYVAGTKKELLEKGVIMREGGFLGLGKDKDLKDDPNEKYFSELDQRTTQALPIHAKKAHLITEHPDSSYKFILENDQVAYLQIEDPSEFWKLSRYLVVETRK